MLVRFKNSLNQLAFAFTLSFSLPVSLTSTQLCPSELLAVLDPEKKTAKSEQWIFLKGNSISSN